MRTIVKAWTNGLLITMSAFFSPQGKWFVNHVLAKLAFLNSIFLILPVSYYEWPCFSLSREHCKVRNLHCDLRGMIFFIYLATQWCGPDPNCFWHISCPDMKSQWPWSTRSSWHLCLQLGVTIWKPAIFNKSVFFKSLRENRLLTLLFGRRLERKWTNASRKIFLLV